MIAAEAFWGRADRSAGPAGCWPWIRTRTVKGYGIAYVGNYREAKAHRIAYQLTVGAIPAGLLVMHTCDNPPCVNPAHLFLGTNADNMRDMVAKGRQPAQMRPRLACRRGHAFTDDNVYLPPGDGRRRCLTCRRNRVSPRAADPDLAGVLGVAACRDGDRRPPEAPELTGIGPSAASPGRVPLPRAGELSAALQPPH